MDKVVLITGGTSAIGIELIKAFMDAQYNVVFTYCNNIIKAKTIIERFSFLNSKIMSARVDVTDESQVKKMFSDIQNEFGRIDVLINNAGIYRDGITKNLSSEDWNQVISINLNGTFNCVKGVIPIMEKNRYGRIVNIGSIVGEIGAIGTASYAASKAGIIGFTKTVAREVARKGITANVISLGYMNDGMTLEISEAIQEKIMKQIPMQAFGDVEKIAKMIVHFTSAESEYITGQNISINGGLSM